MDQAFSGDVDVLVVGGGPVGAAAARGLSARGHRTLLVEEHELVGTPMQCAGLFTPRIFDLAGFPSDDILLNEIRGAHMWSPGGRRLTIDGGKTMAVAINRPAFDQRCVEQAERSGARVLRGTRALSAERDRDGVAVRLDRRGEHATVRTRLLVGADGVQANVARWFGLPRARELLPCYGAQMKGLADVEEPYVEMFFGRDLAPGFFAWIVPQGGGFGMVEMGMNMGAERLGPESWPVTARDRWLRMAQDPRASRMVASARPVYEVCACIPIGAAKRTTSDRVMIVGDAAGQAKPTTGGGVYTGLKCARHLVDVADAALAEDDLSDARLSEYHARWQADVGREIAIGYRLRRTFAHLTDEQTERLFETVDDPDLLATVNVLGDIDYPSRLARQLFKKAPSLLRYGAPALVKSLFS